MGGKTQPRVAGNIKPSSSGRIRELLINTQGAAAGNVITFSALSNNQSSPRPAQQPNPIDTTTPDSKHTETFNQSISPNSEPTPSPSKSERPTLVLKRVNGRDYFTRVKASEVNNADPNSSQTVCLIGDKVGVMKPETSLEGSMFDEANKEPVVDEETRAQTKDDSPQESSDSDSETDIDDDVNAKDFDAIVDRLTQIVIDEDKSKISSSRSLDEISDEDLATEVEKMKLFRILVRHHSEDLSIEEWDLLVTSINQWVSWISRVKLPIKNSERSEFCTNVFKCLYQFMTMAKGLDPEDESCSRFILESWNDFHSSSVYQELVRIYMNLVALENELNHNDEQLAIIEAVAEIIVEVDPTWAMLNDKLITNQFASNKLEFDPDFKQPDLANYCDIDETKFKAFISVCGLMRSNHRVILVPAYMMLSQTMSSLCESIHVSALTSDQDDSDNALVLPPTPLMAILTSRDLMMKALLSDFNAGDISVTIEPNTDSYSCTLSYLLIWDLVIQFIVGVDKELGHKIIHALKKLDLIRRLLDNVFMLLPPLGERDSLNLRMPRSKQASHGHWTLTEFLKSPLITFIKRPINEIELVALHTYFSMACHMPVTVRKWYNNNSNKRLCNLVNEYTVKRISQVICSLEMDNVLRKCQERATQDESNNLIIKARPSAKEVYATYIRDEFKMELTIKLPNNYPLGPVQIDGGKRVGVTDLKWRSWLLQLTTFLAHQNGPILDGIDLWRKNIDKKFEGIEKCTICFSILHSNYQLPKKRCQTCTKMFHNLCLYKWFESSGNTTCPLCRTPW